MTLADLSLVYVLIWFHVNIPFQSLFEGCGCELTSTAREVRTRPGYTAQELNELYCLRCHDRMGIPICGACRRPIEGRVVTALGKHWCVEHFVCAKCEKPFMGNRHYERKGLAYCETHYHQLFGNLCYVCNQVIQSDVFTALNKAWCVNHFACSACDQKMTVKTKFYEVDLKPVCKKCYDKYPRDLRLRLKKYHESEAARDQRQASVWAFNFNPSIWKHYWKQFNVWDFMCLYIYLIDLDLTVQI